VDTGFPQENATKSRNLEQVPIQPNRNVLRPDRGAQPLPAKAGAAEGLDLPAWCKLAAKITRKTARRRTP
jgi:hypothetical protein